VFIRVVYGSGAILAIRSGNMMARRSTGKTRMARALWYVKKGAVELRAAPLPPPGPGYARVRSLFSGISRGTERLVLLGAIGPSEWERMRAPMQEGAFPFPVKYGYAVTGIVETGPANLMGRPVFALHPHQDYFNAPIEALIPIPEGLPARRATLAANMETALNAIWDSGAGPGDRIVVVGAGVVGLLLAALAARLPGAIVTAVDVEEQRRPLAEGLGLGFARPEHAPTDADVVFHTSATGAGLDAAIRCAGLEAPVVEVSWYGDRPATLELGGAFHSRRLRILSSQVGQISPSRRPRWSFRRRLEAALGLLASPALDALVAEEIAFETAARGLPKALSGEARALAPVICYPQA
jgi:NADPH:quinone reductase-like Zn-dependent oxidoreductase